MRFHLLALPNVQTTSAYSLDGFCTATIRFAKLLKGLGHTVILYASEDNEAPCDELVTVITKEEQRVLLGSTEYQYAAMEEKYPLWALANPRMVAGIAARKQPRDFIAIIGGASHESVAAAHPDLIAFEYSVGYVSSFAKYRVFASSAWRHFTYGAQGTMDGGFYDAVIPNFVDPDDFKFRAEKEPFALYVGRLVPRKGLEVACRAASEAGILLKVAGHGDPSLVTDGAQYMGVVSATERNELMSQARVLLAPTVYVEPFGHVAIEAQICGTPVIATDFGGFVESVEHGQTGFRCSTLQEFVTALGRVESLDPYYIRQRALDNYTITAAAPKYQAYFDRLMTLWDGGWYKLDRCA